LFGHRKNWHLFVVSKVKPEVHRQINQVLLGISEPKTGLQQAQAEF
jgi:hypothetical protein